MRFIPTLLHALADYVVGCIVIALPFLLGWTGVQAVALVALGAFVLVYSLMTDYELSLVRLLPFRMHLLLDAIFVVAVLILPSALDIAGAGRIALYVIACLGFVLTLATKTPAGERP